jgi:epoxyqueuosine reductase
MGRAVIGCDICQDVCPWNRKSATTSLPAFQPRSVSATIASDTESSLFAPELEWIASLTQQDFSRIFRGSAIKRAKWRGIVRNACVALGNSQLDRKSKSYPRVISLLQQLSASPEPLIAEHANWALDRLQ